MKTKIFKPYCIFALALASCSEILPSDADQNCANICEANNNMIIGCDNRVTKPDGVDGTTEEPWSFIGRLHGISCSGTLISDRFVLTAAHCLTSLNSQSQLGFALAQAIQHEDHRPFGTHGVRRIFIPASYGNGGSEEVKAYDFAIIELWEPIVGATPAQWGYVDWDILRTKPVFTAGYPGTQPDGGLLGRPWISGDNGGTYHDNQPYQSVNGGEAGLLYTDLDGTGGQSGSAVYSLLTPSQHDGEGIIRKVSGVLLGSPVNACMNDQMWVASLTPTVVEEIENAMNQGADLRNSFWRIIELARSPTTGQGEPWP